MKYSIERTKTVQR